MGEKTDWKGVYMERKNNNTACTSKEAASSTPYRILALILTFSMLLALGLCACSGKSTETTKKKKKAKKTTKETVETVSEPEEDPPTTSKSDTEPSDTSKNDPFATTTEEPTNSTSTENPVVGISLPTKALKRWADDGQLMKELLEADGYAVDLQFASNDISTQQVQIENMINEECQVLIIAAIDGDSLTNVLDFATTKNITVIAYDRLLRRTDAVSYYVTFDNYMVGTLQGEYIRIALDLDNADGPFNMEIFTGDPGDFNAKYFYDGAMDVLQPYISSGQLVVKSGQTDFYDVGTANWSTDNAQTRMDTILTTYYSDGSQLDAILCSNDSTALGAELALATSYTGNYPVITGQDCDITNVRNILSGYQSMSVFKDTRESVKATVNMAEEILTGSIVTVNDTSTYNNETINVPSYLVSPVVVDKSNYEEILVDSGYYKKSDLS